MLSYIALAAVFSRARGLSCTADSDCPQYGFKCDVDNDRCYPACTEDADCNAIWGYEGATCDTSGDVYYCSPDNLVPTESGCDSDDDCADGFSCFVDGADAGIFNFCYPGCEVESDCDALGDAYSCVDIDYVAFSAMICTAEPSVYACDTDDDCEGDLMCFGSGPASLCYVGCGSDDDCASGYECVTDDFSFTACRPADVDLSCTDTCSGDLEGFACVNNLCAPVCTEGDDDACAALTGDGSVCVTMNTGTGEKLSICEDSAVSTANSICSADSDCPQYGFKCDVDNDRCYPACTEDADCNAIWGYEGATCDMSGDVGYCSPDNLVPESSECSVDGDCDDGFSCFDASDLGIPNFCYPDCEEDADCDALGDAYSCVDIDYVAFSDKICTAAPSNYACDTDEDCDGGLKCFGSGPASLCYVGCGSDDDCASGYECVTDDFTFTACRPADVDLSCSDTCEGDLAGFTCVNNLCAPVCTEGDDDSCTALTGEGSVCATMNTASGEKLSICDDSAVSTISTPTPAPTELDNGSAAAPMHSVMMATMAALAAASMALLAQ